VHAAELLILGLCVALPALSVIARLLHVPYPIVLVLGAIPLGYLPGIPEVELDPDLVLVIFLPPLLYVAAFMSDLRALRADARARAPDINRANADAGQVRIRPDTGFSPS
jgi:monovalent cation/hydrogen antiporter